MRTLRARFLDRLRGEGGVTLPELLIYSLLSVVVLGIVGNILIQSLRVTQTVRAVDETATNAQLAGFAVERGIRNASAFRLTPNGPDQFLVARVAGAGDTITWMCTAWYFDNSKQELRQKQSPGSIVMPDDDELKQWTLLGENIEKLGTDPHIFSGSWPTLDLAYDGAAEGYARVTIAASATARPTIEESAPCF